MAQTSFSLDAQYNPADSLAEYLIDWDTEYKEKVSKIALFQPEKTAQWSTEQQQHFIKTFYHVRGHFHCFLWFMGNFAPDKESKDMVLQNIIDELGDRGLSHEKLYHILAQQVGVDLMPEMLEEKTYLPFIQEFNKGHLRWLSDKDWPTRVAAFAALERLDNVDYANAKAIAESLGLHGQALVFFNVHINSAHFDSILEKSFTKIWAAEPEKSKYAFQFIMDHQINMWKNLSDEIFAYA